MEKLRVKKEREYVIEVNDKGDTISFNLEDPTLLLKMEKAYEAVSKASDKFNEKLDCANELCNEKEEDHLLEPAQRNTLIAFDELYRDLRNEMDIFLGEGACQKIFGDSNYLSMFEELFAELRPHFKKMGLTTENYLQTIADKYGIEEKDTLEA